MVADPGFELPNDWDCRALSELVDLERGISYGIVQPGTHDPLGVPIVRVNNLKQNRIITDDVLRVTPNIESKYSRTRLRGGEALLTLVGSLGEAAVVPKELAGWNVARAVGVIPVESDIGSEWVVLCLRTPAIQHYMQTWATTTVQATLNLREVSQLPIPIPPKPEREAIAHILGTLDDKIELNRRTNETLEAMARALFKSWFVDFDPVRAKVAGRQPYGMDAETAALFRDSFEDSPLGEVPRGWKVGKLRECCLRVENGGTPRRDEPEYWEPGTVPWLTSGEVRQSIVVETENFISEEGRANSSAKLWPSGTTVVALYGATAGQVCFLAKHMCANQACCGLVSAESTRFYLYLYTSSSVEAFVQQARGSAQQNLSQQIVADFPTLIPASEVLKSFENRVRPLFEKWIANLNESRTLAALRDALLPRLLSGEVRVKDAEAFIGHAL